MKRRAKSNKKGISKRNLRLRVLGASIAIIAIALFGMILYSIIKNMFFPQWAEPQYKEMDRETRTYLECRDKQSSLFLEAYTMTMNTNLSIIDLETAQEFLSASETREQCWKEFVGFIEENCAWSNNHGRLAFAHKLRENREQEIETLTKLNEKFVQLEKQPSHSEYERQLLVANMKRSQLLLDNYQDTELCREDKF